jgi:hypothetical protein
LPGPDCCTMSPMEILYDSYTCGAAYRLIPTL